MGAFFHELLRVGIYKRSQGRIVRQVTFAALAVTFALGVWRLSEATTASSMAAGAEAWLKDTWLVPFYWIAVACSRIADTPVFHLWFPGLLLLVFCWMSYRLVNLPAFADFLIAVEGEINKVSWPTRSEAFRASMVVLILMFFLAFTLYAYDFFWQMLLTKILHLI